MTDALEEKPAPPTTWSPPRTASRAAGVRLWAGVVLLGCAGLWGLAAYLQPDPRGYGTHSQLGTGPCGMLIMTGYPCPTCGMTTAFAHTVRGQWLRALWVQPGGFILALATGATGLVAAWMVIAGRWPRANVWFITPYRAFLALLILLMGSWAFKVVTGLLDGSLPLRP